MRLPLPQAARRVQGGFLGVEERLEPLEGVPVLEDAEAGADHAQDAAVGLAADGLVRDLGLGVGGDERHQFHVPRQPRLLAGLRPVVQVGFVQRRAEAVPGSLLERTPSFRFRAPLLLSLLVSGCYCCLTRRSSEVIDSQVLLARFRKIAHS